MSFLGSVEWMSAPEETGFERTVEVSVISKSFGAEKGFIGITVRGTATAAFGVRGRASLDPANFVLNAGPWGRVGVSGEVGLDVLIASASVEGEVTLLEDYFYGQAAARMDAPGGGPLSGSLQFSLINDFTGPTGRIDVVGRVSKCAGLDSLFGGLLGSCGDLEERKTILGPYTLVSTSPQVLTGGPETGWASCAP